MPRTASWDGREISEHEPEDAVPRQREVLWEDGELPPGVTSLAEFDRAKVPYRAETIVLRGLVGPPHRGCSRSAGESWWTHAFQITAWCGEGEAPQERDLYAMHPVRTPEETHDIAPGRVVEIEVLLAVAGDRAVVRRVLGVRSDLGEFAAIAARLSAPVVVAHPRLGELTLDRERGWFVASIPWCGAKAELILHARSPAQLSVLLPTAEALFDDADAWHRRVQQRIVDDLLDLARDWASEVDDEEGDDGAELTAAHFLDRIRLTSIDVSSDEFSFWFDDGDVFLGHVISARGTLVRGVFEATMQG